MRKITREEIIAIVQDVKKTANAASLRDEIKLEDQGLDSLDMFSIILRIQENFAMEIPDSDIDKLDTMNNIIEYVNNRLL